METTGSRRIYIAMKQLMTKKIPTTKSLCPPPPPPPPPHHHHHHHHPHLLFSLQEPTGNHPTLPVRSHHAGHSLHLPQLLPQLLPDLHQGMFHPNKHCDDWLWQCTLFRIMVTYEIV